MRTNIIDDLKSYYLNQNVKVQSMFMDNKMKCICDSYFKEDMSYLEISRKYNMSVRAVKNLMIKAVGLMIRKREW